MGDVSSVLKRLDSRIAEMERRFPPRRDRWGLLPSDYEAIRKEQREHDDRMRWRAIQTLWGKPVIERVRYDGVTIYRDSREEEWTFWRSILATIALILNRRWTDKARLRRRAKGHRFDCGMALCFWDSHSSGYGHSAQVCDLHPGVRVSIYSDGD